MEGELASAAYTDKIGENNSSSDASSLNPSKHHATASSSTSTSAKGLQSHSPTSPKSILNTHPSDLNPQSSRELKIGIETGLTRAEGDTWDDDFAEVDEMAFDSSTYQNDDDQDEGSDSEEHGEKDACVSINLRSLPKRVAGSEERAMESVERAEIGDTVGADEFEEREGEHPSFDAGRMTRSMNPSPQPPSVAE
ncbi:hypothetical protein WAI453_000669 [Rhynchosporium graminicola]|uniref:Uncharacterized protein n=1 Tax=Rhynchosporium graminicola TaxID=2792576 RepID=A0A1E1JR51_9HELO|nr:uncharacterized protein RCO7_01201 [Rhynchosporium commune]